MTHVLGRPSLRLEGFARLLEEGSIKAKVVIYDRSRYTEEGAGRYSLRPSALKLLDEHLGR
jgi:hypothetical protein